MRHHGRDYADQINVVASDESAPIIFDVLNVEFARNFLSVLAVGAGDRYYPRAVAVFEAGNLRRASKPRPNDSKADYFVGHERNYGQGTRALSSTQHWLGALSGGDRN
jgi:hypothetical protein